jgi:hypothetical protein
MTDPHAAISLVVSLAVIGAIIGVYQLVCPACPRCGGRSWDKYDDLNNALMWRCNSCGDWIDWR